jgi:hypothetical protein
MNRMKIFEVRLQPSKPRFDRAGEALEARLQQRHLEKPAEAMKKVPHFLLLKHGKVRNLILRRLNPGRDEIDLCFLAASRSLTA